jgi:hypothetical protein
MTIYVGANTLYYTSGGHLWVYLNWALGLRALGCQVVWLETVIPHAPVPEIQMRVAALKRRLEPYGLAECLALCSWAPEPLPAGATEGCLDLRHVDEADLLLDLRSDMPPAVVGRFRRSALVDLDPGLLQTWMSQGRMSVARHDVYFSIGETVGQPLARFPDMGLKWHYTPPCVALDWWPVRRAPGNAPLTTVSHWYANEYMVEAGKVYANDKRTGFLPFLDLPLRTGQPLELAISLAGDDNERRMLEERGWRVREAHGVASTPWEYQRYIQDSLGEFSCVKPGYVRLQTVWTSDRTPCYLASGKPAVVQHTGASRFLPDAAGLFRFRDLDEAARCLETVAADYDRQCSLARTLAQEFFDARKVVARVLERALA